MTSPDGASSRAGGKEAALIAAFLGWMFDGLEMGLFPLVARPALLSLGVEPGSIMTWNSTIVAAFLVGAALGGVVFGWLGDRFGRVRAMTWSVLVYAVFSDLCCLAQAPWHLAALRFVASLGMGGEWSLGVALVMEVWPSASRPLLAGLIGAAANLGYLVIGIVALWVDREHWRILLFFGAAPAALTFFIRLFVPESEKWRAASRGAARPRVAEIFAGPILKRTLLATALGAIALLGTWGSVQWLPLWADKLSRQQPGATAWTQVASSGGAVVGTIAAALLAEALSRRMAYFGFALLSLGVCAYLFRAPLEYGAWFLCWVFAAGASTASFYGWLPLYLPELFPTRIRATGQGFAFNSGRVVAACGTLASAQILREFGEDYARMCSVISLVYVLGLVVIWFCPETKGKPLPE